MKKVNLIAGAVLAGFAAAIAYKKIKTFSPKFSTVENFQLDKYLGKWYEIARLDHWFENELINTTAEYSLNEDASINVVNRGYNIKKERWEEIAGKAKVVDPANEAMLKVSFFGPFYQDYNVIALDTQYKYAMVAGKNFDYLWLLSREKEMPEAVVEFYLSEATRIGYDVANLVWVEQA
jgi:apolipoprotein D and lipocalin family protein